MAHPPPASTMRRSGARGAAWRSHLTCVLVVVSSSSACRVYADDGACCEGGGGRPSGAQNTGELTRGLTRGEDVCAEYLLSASLVSSSVGFGLFPREDVAVMIIG